MKIGIDAACWWSNRGFGRFTRELLKAMFTAPNGNEFCLFVDRQPVPDMIQPGVDVVMVNTDRHVTESAVASGSRSLRDLYAFSRAVSKQSLDVMFFPAVYSWFPVRRRLPVVVTLHDAIAEHYPDLIFPDFRGRLLWGLKMRLACWQAHRIMTVSSAAKDEIVQHIGIDAGRIDVVSEAADPRFRQITDSGLLASARERNKLPVGVRIIVYVGGFAPHKNLHGLLEGFEQALEMKNMEDVHLAMIGDPGGDGFHSNYQQLHDRINTSSRLRGRVHFTGFVPDEDLVALYSDALAVILPSYSEGFGLPAIEAMACRIPVLASRSGSLPEVVGDGGLYFDPHDTAQIAACIGRIAGERETLSILKEKAYSRSRGFTWSRAAELSLGFLEKASGKG